MKTVILVLAALLAFYPIRSPAQELNSWGHVFTCAVDWFGKCRPPDVTRKRETANPREMPLGAARSPPMPQEGRTTHLPAPVRNVLENPSPETAKAYVRWSRQASERLAEASEYIAEATHEMNSEIKTNEGNRDLGFAGVGPVGLYYFFSPGEPSAVRDVAVLNKIWREGRIGVIGIPVRGNSEEIGEFINEAKPRFPLRRSDSEVQLVKPGKTPSLHLALPLEKRIFRLGTITDELSIMKAIHNALLVGSKRNSGFIKFDAD